LGAGPVLRLQVPATPDPYDDATSETHRRAVLELLPERTTPADAEPVSSDAEPVLADAEPVPADAAVAER
jgi:hypothetical protein